MAETTPPPLQGPTSKEKKYDRQLRLWAASGQQALEESHVLLVNPSLVDIDDAEGNNPRGTGVVGVEALKNLILPGIGNYTIVDDATVSELDLGVNFFLEEESLGKSRAEETCRLLQELNPDVKGNFIPNSIESLLITPNSLSPYNLILLIAPLSANTLERICSIARDGSIPVFYIHSVGFYSSFSLQLPSLFPIVDTHPEPESAQDLRLFNPWQELLDAVKSIENLADMDDHEHGHVPYILLLLYYLQRWRTQNEGKPPENYKQKTAFKEMIRAGARTNNPEGGEENYDEAVGAVMKSINPYSIGSNVREMFEIPECVTPTKDSTNFWVIASAMRQFHSKHGTLPLPGLMPDMKAQSADYIRLQNIYKNKARRDVQEVKHLIHGIEASLGREDSPIPDVEIEAFCKNAAHIKIVHGSSSSSLPIIPGAAYLQHSSLSEKSAKRIIASNLKNNEDSLLPIWLVLTVFDMLAAKEPGRYSSSLLDDEEAWARLLNSQLSCVFGGEKGVVVDEEISARVERIAQELRRYSGGELHNIAALTGGIVAQEAIKVITRQYVPVDNTCVFDGVFSRSEVFKLA